jgi:hypothetical protein
MPSVMDAPARVDHDTHDLHDKQPQVRTTPRGFWRTVMQYVRRPRVRTSSRHSLHPTESPMARLAQEHPMLYLLGFCGIHSG